MNFEFFNKMKPAAKVYWVGTALSAIGVGMTTGSLGAVLLTAGGCAVMAGFVAYIDAGL